jgi:hypothetical protein
VGSRCAEQRYTMVTIIKTETIATGQRMSKGRETYVVLAQENVRFFYSSISEATGFSEVILERISVEVSHKKVALTVPVCGD